MGCALYRNCGRYRWNDIWLNQSIIFPRYKENVFGKELTTNIGVFGTIIGIYFGAITGGVIGLLSWAVVGIIAPPSRNLLPPKQLTGSMLIMMGMAMAFGLLCYFIWPAVTGPFRYGYVEALQDGIFLAMFGIPALMGIGQIACVWRAAIRLRDTRSEI